MSPLSHISTPLRFLNEWVPARLGPLDRPALLKRPGGEGNHALWILGHMTASRGFLQGLIGVDGPAARDWEERLFGMGSSLLATDGYPATDEILSLFQARGSALVARLEAMTEAEAARPHDLKLPFGGPTLRGEVRLRGSAAGRAASGSPDRRTEFLVLHETYHHGQLSYAGVCCCCRAPWRSCPCS